MAKQSHGVRMSLASCLCVFVALGMGQVMANEPSSLPVRGETQCTVADSHPVCRASFAVDPSGTLGNTGRSTGTAVINGVEVKFVCTAGVAQVRQPRQCKWQ